MGLGGDGFAVFAEELEEGFDGSESFLELGEHRGEAADGAGDEPGHQQKGEEMAARQPAGRHQVRAFENDQRDGPEDEQDDERGERAAPNCAAHREGSDARRALCILRQLEAFIRKRFDTDNARERFLDDGIRFGNFVLCPLRQPLDEPAEAHGREDHHGQGDEHEQGEGDGEVHQGCDAAYDDDELAQQLGEGDREDVLDGGDVRGNTAVEVAHAAPVKKAHRQRDDRGKGIVAHPLRHVLGHAGEEPNPRVTQHRLDDQHDGNQRADVPQGLHFPRHKAFPLALCSVHSPHPDPAELAPKPRHGQRQDAAEAQQDNAHGEPYAVGAEVGAHSAEFADVAQVEAACFRVRFLHGAKLRPEGLEFRARCLSLHPSIENGKR